MNTRTSEIVRANMGAFLPGMFSTFRNVSLTSELEVCALNIV